MTDCLERTLSTMTLRDRVIACTVDLVHGPRHDFARGAMDFRLRSIGMGLVIASFCSPPCETWPIARHIDPNPFGLSPLRSADRPWELPGLKMLEYC